MARIQHLAIASQDPEKQAEFFKQVFGFEEIRRLDNPRARGLYASVGFGNPGARLGDAAVVGVSAFTRFLSKPLEAPR